MARRSCLLAEPRQEFEVLRVAKDPVVGHDGNLEPDCGRGHPTIRLRRLVTQAMPGPDTPGTERGIDLYQVGRVGDDSVEECLGQRLHISTRTVNTRLRHVFAKLGVSNQGALAPWYITRLGSRPLMIVVVCSRGDRFGCILSL
jgi:hypothetical protein